MAEKNRLQAWLALHLTPGLGPVSCNRLVAHFGSPEEVVAAGPAALAEVGSLRRETLNALGGPAREKLAALVRKEMREAAARNVALIPCDDPLYPAFLKKIHDPPVILYVLGAPEALDCRGIGIVGSRAATQYGREVARQMAAGLAGKGLAVISGMALGIDTAAHNGALSAGGKTIAVLGCGLDIVYPPGNRDLHKQIVSSGAVISEFPFGTKPDSFRFPARNRIISGLSLGVLVIEAAIRSGSLITAHHALEQGREVFAVPGRIDSMKSAGTHALLQQGAKLVLNINDIIEEIPSAICRPDVDGFGGEGNGQDPPVDLSPEEAELYGCLDIYPRPLEDIILESGLSAQKANELLLHLELRGVIEQLPGTLYKKSSVLSGS